MVVDVDVLWLVLIPQSDSTSLSLSLLGNTLSSPINLELALAEG